MSLPTGADLKTYLRIETDAEDDLLELLMSQAVAAIETWLDRPIQAVERTFVDEAVPDYRAPALRRLMIPVTPVSAVPPPTVTDVDDELEDVLTYRLDLDNGFVIKNAGEAGFDNGPYTIVATVGLSVHRDFDTRIEPLLGRAALDLASQWYHQRNAGASSVSTAGTATSAFPNEIPPRICAMLTPFRLVRGA